MLYQLLSIAIVELLAYPFVLNQPSGIYTCLNIKLLHGRYCSCSWVRTHLHSPAPTKRSTAQQCFFLKTWTISWHACCVFTLFFVKFPASTNHLFRTYLCTSDDTGTGEPYSAREWHGCPSVQTLRQRLTTIAPYQTNHRHSKSDYDSFSHLWQHCDVIHDSCRTSETDNPKLNPLYSKLLYPLRTAERRPLFYGHLSMHRNWTAAATFLPRSKSSFHHRRY